MDVADPVIAVCLRTPGNAVSRGVQPSEGIL